jgi:oligopeptide/dipeptide ABC transporter ATP-binding protein
MGPAKEIYADPKHPYTRALLSAIPVPDPTKRERKELPKGEVPDAVYPPAGCRFHPRCSVALPTCGWEGRDLLEFLEERWLVADVAKREETLGPIESWTVDGLLATKPLRDSGEAVRALLTSALSEAPAPMREAMVSISVEEGELRVRFRAAAELAPKQVDGRTVECLLY